MFWILFPLKRLPWKSKIFFFLFLVEFYPRPKVHFTSAGKLKTPAVFNFFSCTNFGSPDNWIYVREVLLGSGCLWTGPPTQLKITNFKVPNFSNLATHFIITKIYLHKSFLSLFSPPSWRKKKREKKSYILAVGNTSTDKSLESFKSPDQVHHQHTI